MTVEAGHIEQVQRRIPDQTGGFSLLANPFAVLGATARTSLADLRRAADGDASREAAAAALSVPRTRLAAEVSFLPGAAAMTEAVLAALRRDSRFDPADLPSLAAANLRAHLCAAGLAADTDLSGLAAATFVEMEVIGQIDADRVLAGMPAVQAAAVASEIDGLTHQHAAALVAAIGLAPDPASCLAELIRRTPVQGSPVLRRATAAWGRQTSMALSKLGAAAGVAVAAWSAQPSEATAAAVCTLVRQWAALSAPQRLADAAVALDHAVTVRVIQPWRAAARQVADRGLPELALPVADMLADTFADLPGEAAVLREEARGYAGLLEERTLALLLQPLRQFADRMAASPAGLQSALRKRPFGPGASGDAALLWAAFDAACAAATVSEAPYAVMQTLVAAVGGEHRLDGAAAALALQTGMVRRAEQSGQTDLAGRLRAGLRGLERAVARHHYNRQTAKRWRPWWLLPLRRHGTLRAIQRLLPLTDDPGQRSVLLASQTQVRRRVQAGRVVMAASVVFVAAIAAVVGLDDDYAAHAPYRQALPRSVATLQDLPAPAPAPSAPFIDPNPVIPIIPPQDSRPVPHFVFPTHAGERQPPFGLATLGTAELRWCVANDIRLDSAQAAATPSQARGLDTLTAEWHRRCSEPGVRRGDLAAMQAEVERGRARLGAEGLAMLKTAP